MASSCKCRLDDIDRWWIRILFSHANFFCFQWGKHMLASRRMTNTAGNDHKVNKTNVMPIVLVRDPYSWMQSMVSLFFSPAHTYEWGKPVSWLVVV